MSDIYKTISRGGTFTLKERRSKFIATVAPASTVEQAKSFIETTSREYSDARHNCWAYRIGFPETREHCSDDGEPSGSAGRPILGSLVKSELFDLAIVVTRYFGGVKLGVRGLIDAYSLSATGAIEACEKTEKTVTVPFRFETTYGRYGDCVHNLEALSVGEEWIKPDFAQSVKVDIMVLSSLAPKMEEMLEDMKRRSLLLKWSRL